MHPKQIKYKTIRVTEYAWKVLNVYSAHLGQTLVQTLETIADEKNLKNRELIVKKEK